MYAAFSYSWMRPYVTSVCGLTLLVHVAFSYSCMRPEATLAAQVATQLQQHVTRAAHSEQEASQQQQQQQTISVLTAEIKELKMQIGILSLLALLVQKCKY